MIIETLRQGGYDNYRIPGVIRTWKGSLLVYYECRRCQGDWAPIDIGMRKSTDNGRSFSERRLLVDGGGRTENNPIMFSDRDRIVLMWQEDYSRTFSMCSYDDGETWTEPRELTGFTKTEEHEYTVIACGPGHGTVLGNGRYIAPVWFARNYDDLKAHSPSFISTIYSDDKGESWHLGEIISYEGMDMPSEAEIAELEDGVVLINVRHEGGSHRRFTAKSRTGAGEWFDKRMDAALTDPICDAGMVSDGRTVYFSNCRDTEKRINLTVNKSTDGAATWGQGILVDACGGYSDLALDQEYLYIVYEHTQDRIWQPVVSGPGVSELVMKKIRLEDIR